MAPMREEFEAIERNKTWVLIDLPEGHKEIDVKLIFKTIMEAYGVVERYKSRLVAKGFEERSSYDYQDVLLR